MKRIFSLCGACLLLLAGCLPGAPQSEQQIIEDGDSDSEEVVISRDIDTTERFYRSVLPYNPSESRGFILDGVDNRLDIDEFETGLIRLSQTVFDPDDYYIRDGEVLQKDEVQAWIDRRSEDNENGLNPPLGVNDSASVEEKLEANEKNPRYLSFVLEQNYMVERGGSLELGGITIGVSLNSIYYFSVMDDQGLIHSGEVDLRSDERTIINEGKRMAQQIVNDLRQKEEAQDVPIMIALFLEEPRDSLVPGRFVSMASVGSGRTEIGSWEDLNERYYLFPSAEVTRDHRGDAEQFNNFKANVESFFPNFTGVIGKGFYKDGELQRMTVDIPMQFYGKSEVIAFTQHVTELVSSFLADDIPLEVNITSMNKTEAVIVKSPDRSEPFVHIYR